jgi:hypothetical protein
MAESKNIVLDLILIVLTGGIWNLWMQYRQIRDYNAMIRRKEYSFLRWFFFTLLTLGIYHIYHEYKLTRDFCLLNNIVEDVELISILAGVISATGMWIFVDVYQQILLNRKIEQTT